MEKALALNILSNLKGERWDAKAAEAAAKALATSAKEDGLPSEDLLVIANSICEDKLSSSILSHLLRSLIPETDVPNEVLSKVLGWIFTKLGEKNPSVERLCFRWFAGLLQYELCEKESIQLYYQDFLCASLKHQHLEIPGIAIVYCLSGKDDAKKWITQPLLRRYKMGSFPQLTALLSLLKSFRPDLIQESLPDTDKKLTVPHSPYDAALELASNRNQNLKSRRVSMGIVWKSFHPKTAIVKKNRRLIPEIDYLDRIGEIAPVKPIEEFKSMIELGRNQLQVSTPAQVMALLSSEGGFHYLAFAKPSVKAKFYNNLELTFYMAFFYKPGEFSSSEKAFLLEAIATLEEFLQQSISVVNKFLVKYLMIWDGFTYCKLIHSLIEWFTVESEEDWENVKSVLRIYFRTADIDDRCNMLRSLSIMVRNMVSSSIQARLNLPVLLQSNDHSIETSQAITLISDLVSEILVECVTWSRTQDSRSLLGETLSFYHTIANAENEGDFPSMTMIPMTAVYQCLLSNSCLLIERLCSLILKHNSVTQERLYRLGVFEDFRSVFLDFLAVYIMDIYRVLFGGLNFRRDLHPGLFTEDYLEKLNKLKPSNEVPIEKAFLIKNGLGWAVSESKSVVSINNELLLQRFPSTFGIKKLVEDMLQ